MTQTFREYLLECELYPYSQEYFDLVKENYEISMMGKYLENQSFMYNKLNDYTEAGISFSEGYLQEAASINYIIETEEKLKEKKAGFLTKLREKLIKLFQRFVKFFNKLIEKIQKKIDEKKKAIAENNLKLGAGIIRNALTELKKLNDRYHNVDVRHLTEEVAWHLVHSEPYVIKPSIDNGAQTPIPVKALVAVVKEAKPMIVNGDISPAKTEKVLKMIEDAQNDTRKNGIIVEAEGNEINEIKEIDAEVKSWSDTSNGMAIPNKPGKRVTFDRNNLEDDNGMAVPRSINDSSNVSSDAAKVVATLSSVTAATSSFYNTTKNLENDFLDLLSGLRNQGIGV